VLGQSGWQVERLPETDAAGDRLVHQHVQRGSADSGQHRRGIIVAGTDMTGLERLWVEDHRDAWLLLRALRVAVTA